MTYDDDFVRLEFSGGVRQSTCKFLGIDWPPPERLDIQGFIMVRHSMSEITDEQRSVLTRVMRGAVYRPAGEP